jgi:hypothetical protein
MSEHTRSSPSDGWWFLAFVVLVFVGAAVVSLPGSDRPPDTIHTFYAAHRTAVTLTQVAGLVAAGALIMVIRALLRWVGGGWPLVVTGALVVLANVGTAIPVLRLAYGAGGSVATSLARWGDWTDDILFIVIGLFAAVLATVAPGPALRIGCALVAVLCTTRGVGGALGLTALDVVAPLAFLVLMVWFGITRLRAGPTRVIAGSGDPLLPGKDDRRGVDDQRHHDDTLRPRRPAGS